LQSATRRERGAGVGAAMRGPRLEPAMQGSGRGAHVMTDIVYLVATIAFFVAAAGYVRGCESL
jgi:hypothetical protein